MPYRFKIGESVPAGILRIAREELESAAGVLANASPSNRDEAIHEARKSIKKTRALLRLASPQLQGRFGRENRRLRDVGRKLSAHRDTAVMIESFDGLHQKYLDDLHRKKLSLASIRRALLDAKRESERGAARIAGQGSAALAVAARAVEDWPLHGSGFRAIAPGLRETYRAARQAITGDPHEWRKRVKDHWYHIRLLEDLWTDLMVGQEKSLKDLETWLGEYHNLEVLWEMLKAHPERYGKREEVDQARKLVSKYQKELMANSQSLAERLFEERPGDFQKRMKHLWSSWRAQPDTLKEVEKEKRHEAAR